ncbi:MAG: helix-turn-helix domain-containing protein [Natronospirillum sp.]|uniref:helix-turn-helix domain-containing protein n=1 Tax=Natronospirillum sp. TaxID=2812955 RepID=UPI0025E25B3A|nr:helix-turn-helix transcriptional regulator [Natronospirillum sp.]MCH8550861.1 helix-turn-helix domain-containing protein [Natronospirillum sp.]
MIDNFEFLAPPADLQSFIKFIWVFEGRASAEDPYFHRTPVDGCTQLIFAFRGGFCRQADPSQCSQQLKSALIAQTTTSLTYRLSEDFGLFGVCLYPFSIPYLTGIEGPDFIDRYFAPGDLLGEPAKELAATMASVDRNEHRLALVQNLLSPLFARRSTREPQVIGLLRQLFSASDADELEALSHPSTISSRHLQRQVKRYTGYTPKQLVRILRLQLAMQSDPAPALSDIATRGDYYDQSHLSNEFRSLSGTTPGDYFKGLKPDIRWRREGREVAFFQSRRSKKP